MTQDKQPETLLHENALIIVHFIYRVKWDFISLKLVILKLISLFYFSVLLHSTFTYYVFEILIWTWTNFENIKSLFI